MNDASLPDKLQPVALPGVQAGPAYAARHAGAARRGHAGSQPLLPCLPERPTGAAFSAVR